MKNVCITKSYINNNFKNHIIFICDHANNKIPAKYKGLGLARSELESHIAYDLGAKNFVIELTKKLRQSYVISNFSRLIIDPNRSKSSNDLIVQDSFGTRIPGNNNIDKKEKNDRIEIFYDKYHFELSEFVKKKKRIYEKVFLISIHSFTKKSKKFNRGIEVGLLWNKNMNLLLPIQRELKVKNIFFGRNFPYSGFHFNYTLDRLYNDLLLDSILIEIRNDLICYEKGITKYVDIFSKIFNEFLNG